jgi:hypothetical protein
VVMMYRLSKAMVFVDFLLFHLVFFFTKQNTPSVFLPFYGLDIKRVLLFCLCFHKLDGVEQHNR